MILQCKDAIDLNGRINRLIKSQSVKYVYHQDCSLEKMAGKGRDEESGEHSRHSSLTK